MFKSTVLMYLTQIIKHMKILKHPQSFHFLASFAKATGAGRLSVWHL